MGFRSTITGEDYHFEWPTWFIDKYQDIFLLSDSTCINNRWETKFYDNVVFEDIQKAIDWEQFTWPITYAILHEDGAISRVIISKDKIKYNWMEEGHEADHVWCQG